MIFNGTDDQKVEIKIINYQYPENINGDFDGNWLLIYLNVISKVGNWQTVDPFLTTWEVQELIEWFKELSIDKIPKWKIQTFTEPNLSLAFLKQIADKKIIRINFAAECRPQSADLDKKYFVDCAWTNVELKRISEDLKNELGKYPERNAK